MTRTEKWLSKRAKITEVNRLDELEYRMNLLESRLDALTEIVKYLDTHKVSAKAFDDMFDDPLETLEEIFKI